MFEGLSNFFRTFLEFVWVYGADSYSVFIECWTLYLFWWKNFMCRISNVEDEEIEEPIEQTEIMESTKEKKSSKSGDGPEIDDQKPEKVERPAKI
jgi:hypothetical protein